MGLGAWSLGFGIWGLGFRGGLVFKAHRLFGLEVWGLEFTAEAKLGSVRTWWRVEGLGFEVQGLGFRVEHGYILNLGFRVQGLELRV